LFYVGSFAEKQFHTNAVDVTEPELLTGLLNELQMKHTAVVMYELYTSVFILCASCVGTITLFHKKLAILTEETFVLKIKCGMC
jgi:hypothetical protein